MGRLFHAVVRAAFTATLLVLAPVAGAAPDCAAPGDDPVPAYRIDLSPWESARELARLGLDLVEMRPHSYAVALGWPGTREALESSTLGFERLTSDLGGDLAERSRRDIPAGFGAATQAVPSFGEGSMLGFWTYSEVLALLDSLVSHDDRDILTVCDTLGFSVENRPIVALGVFDQSRPAGTRPEVLLTALTHAREPMSMQSVLYFLCHLVEHYGKDPRVTHLVNEREIWFVPVVNPDGYVRNEATFRETGGFGFWRKNLRDNDSDGAIGMNDGVDLNRNFGFRWGFDDYGSSPDPRSQVYRGSKAFSEPETRALRDFCTRHAFVTANNVHAYYDATLYPWGHSSERCPDAQTYVDLVDQITRHNGHAYGHSDQVLYPVNGDADDWLYGDQVSKAKCLSMTSEIGTREDGFWPSPSRIHALAAANVHAFMTLAQGAGDLFRARNVEVSPALEWDGRSHLMELNLSLANLGIKPSAGESVTLRARSLTPGVSVKEEDTRALRRADGLWYPEVPLQVGIEDGTGPVTRIQLDVLHRSRWLGGDTLTVTLGVGETLFADDGTLGLKHWVPSGLWGIELWEDDPVFSDSPGTRYANGASTSLTLVTGLDLSRSDRALLRFRSLWNIESAYDFGLVEVSPDSGATWIPLEGEWTREGSGGDGAQPQGAPGFQGNRRVWKRETMDLTAFAGHEDLRLRFRLATDRGLSQDGWLIDDIQVLGYGHSARNSVAEATLPGGPPAASLSARE